MNERINEEVLALRKIAQNGGYSLGCNTCGDEPSRVVAEIDENGTIAKKMRKCDGCLEGGFNNDIIEGNR